jgi:hypothetical protein
MVSSDMAFSQFIDSCLYEYGRSAGYRHALHKEAPRPRKFDLCPPEHLHGATTTCYANHKCRCERCKSAWKKYQRQARMKKALAEIARAEEGKTA